MMNISEYFQSTKPTFKNILAREWIIFVCCMVIGLFITLGFYFASGSVVNYVPDYNHAWGYRIYYTNPFDHFWSDMFDYFHPKYWLKQLWYYAILMALRFTYWSIRIVFKKPN